MTRIDQVQFGIGNVPLVSLRSFQSEKGIIDSPNNQHSRLLDSEILVPFLVKLHIGLVTVKKVKLNRVVAEPVEKELIDRVRIRKAGSRCTIKFPAALVWKPDGTQCAIAPRFNGSRNHRENFR